MSGNEGLKKRVIELCDSLITQEDCSHQDRVRVLEVIKSLVGSIDKPPRSTLMELHERNPDLNQRIEEYYKQYIDEGGKK